MQPTGPLPADFEQFGPLFIAAGCFVVLLSLIATGFLVWAWCRIFRRAGFHWAWGLLMLVPIAAAILPFILAFAEWPLHKELAKLRNRVRADSPLVAP